MSKKKVDWLYPSKWKGIWYFIWEDNSLLSWIVNVILAFVLIKFIIYPGLGLLFSTSYPIVAVVSGSMEHQGNFDAWWGSSARCSNNYCSQAEYYSNYGITKTDFQEFSFKNGFNKGDLMVLMGTKPKNIKTGDVIVFQSNRPDPIIHRTIKVWYQDDKYHFQTKGDHNQGSYIQVMETDIQEDRLLGKAVLRIPFLGWIKIAFVNMINSLR
ncbi:signal peptidase I [Candidatus Woesearchaeota archaeon]|nr:signal peptidase I [Candidatus Woesearchaeota archaeon]MBL7050631.1 signal peptidase I [Candidatus Woesearchaeota archaeon]